MPKAAKDRTLVHVIFTAEGLAGWFGPAPVPGSEPLDIEDLRPLLPYGAPDTALTTGWRDLLIRHCRVDGVWLPRPVVVPALSAGEAPAPEAAPEAAEVVPTGDAPAEEPRSLPASGRGP